MNLVVHVTNPVDRDEMMTAAGFRIVLGQDDAIVAFLVIDSADVFTIRSNHFDVLLNVQTFGAMPALTILIVREKGVEYSDQRKRL